MKGRIGTQTSGSFSTSPVSGSLGSLASKVAAEEHKKEQEARRAKAVDGRIGKRTKYSDYDIREMRRLHEIEKKTGPEVAAMYGVKNLTWLYSVFGYQIRSRHLP